MLERKLLLKFLLIFTISFVALILVSNIEVVSRNHCKLYSTIATPIFNVLNPHVYCDFSQGAMENENGWDITFKIWDKRTYGRELFVPSFRAKTPPKGILYQNHHELVMVPIIFILALMIASPIGLKAKVIRSLSAIAIFYIFMTLFLSYRFELSLNSQSLPLDSLWHIIIAFFGLGGNTDPIYIACFFLWVILVIPKVIKDLPSVKN